MNEGRLPTFLIIGAMKAGTTTLHGHLRNHSDIFLAPLKEPEFFVAEKNWRRGLNWYRQLFSQADSFAAVGEASTSYAKFTEFAGVPERIASVIPDVRLVYILRQPIDRMVSMYHHQVLTGRETRAIDEALLLDHRYLGPSLYHENLRHYLEWFPREQIHVMLTDDLARDPALAVRGVTRFLGVEEHSQHELAAAVQLRTSDRRADRRLKSRLRGYAAAELAFQRAPAPVQRTLRRMATRSPSPSASVSIRPETSAKLRELLHDDLASLAAELGPGFAAWDLLDGS